MDAPGKIDVGRYIAEMEQILHATDDRTAHLQALEILERWQFDEMLDVASQQRARGLVSRFGRNDWNRI